MHFRHNDLFPKDAVAIILRTERMQNRETCGSFIAFTREQIGPDFMNFRGLRGDAVIWLSDDLDEETTLMLRCLLAAHIRPSNP